jgi:hypothetical protein
MRAIDKNSILRQNFSADGHQKAASMGGSDFSPSWRI